MTRKDYELLASTLERSRIILSDNTVASARYIEQTEASAYAIADALAADNPRFNHEKFLKACGL